METKFTKGNWFVGKFPTTVVSTEKTPINSDDEEVNFYGGYLVAETCDKYTAKLIAAAPDMFNALNNIVEYWNNPQSFHKSLNDHIQHIFELAEKAIQKATE